MMILADIVHGKTGAADVVDLIAVICAALAALLALIPPRAEAAWNTVPSIVRFLGLSALALIALGLLLL